MPCMGIPKAIIASLENRLCSARERYSFGDHTSGSIIPGRLMYEFDRRPLKKSARSTNIVPFATTQPAKITWI